MDIALDQYMYVYHYVKTSLKYVVPPSPAHMQMNGKGKWAETKQKFKQVAPQTSFMCT